MTDTGALTTPDHPTTGRDGARPTTAEWVRIGLSVLGPLITLALAIAVDLLARRGGIGWNPVPLLLISVVFSALCGGLPSGLVSALVTVLYGAHYYSGRDEQLAYGTEGALSLAAIVVAAPLAAVLVVRGARIRSWLAPARRVPAKRPLLAEVATRLSLTSEVEATLQSVARTLVDRFGDGCLIQLLQPDGRLRCAGSAHRVPQRELLVRTLCEQQWPLVQARGDGPDLVTIADQQFGPATALIIPLTAGASSEGRLVLVREHGTGFTPAEVVEAAQLGSRIGLEVGCARLLRERAELEARAGLLFDANPEPMWIFDVETLAFLDVNESALRRYGYERDEMLRMSIMDLHPPAEAAQAAPGPAAERPGVARARHQRRDGSLLDVELTSHELTFQGRNARLVLARDVSDRARAVAALHESEDQLRKAQRSEAIGLIAAGVAHDFNDLLTAVHGYSELLAQDYPPEDPRRKDLEEIRRAAVRGSVLTRQLLGFGSRPAAAPRAVDPNAAIRDLSLLIERLAGAETRLAIVLTPDPGLVWIDPGQLEQVLINLVLHARAAMPVGGELLIETSHRQLGSAGQRRGAKPGRYMAITVSCNGTLAEGPQPEGSALGLSIAYGIVREAGGVLRVLTEPGQGTTLRVYLPQVETHFEDEPAADVLSHGETVLVVEDEEGVRELVRRVLARHGYQVLEARHGKDALQQAEQQDRIDLLLTDVVMPEMGGVALAAALRDRRPDLRVLYMSGYTEDEILRRGEASVGDTGLPLLQKPFSGDELARVVRQALDEPGPIEPVAPDSAANPG